MRPRGSSSPPPRRCEPTPRGEQDQGERHRDGGGQLIDEEEQQVEAQREQRCQYGRTALDGAPGGDSEQGAERGGGEQVAVADHRAAEHRALQPRQARRGVGRVQRVVGLAQQVGDHERGVRRGHRQDPRREPARRRHPRQQRAERRAAERREHERGGLPRQPAAVGPREREQRQHGHDDRAARAWSAPAQREQREQRDAHQRHVRERLRARLLRRTRDEHEGEH